MIKSFSLIINIEICATQILIYQDSDINTKYRIENKKD